jgi:hypothetical protein
MVTRSIGPIHFEDMEPHRFEDLVRALLYDFRSWTMLEPTGRSGSDDGFDARGWEAEQVDSVEQGDAFDEETDQPAASVGRKWLVQCKREKKISPKKLLAYLDEISTDELPSLHGIVFAAACEFSKKAHDAFRERCRELGFNEMHLWGKGTIEDFLLQPKNDHLLFAFVGVSLGLRRRSIRTDLRARLATKRKLVRIFGKGSFVHKECLFRDPLDERYPYHGELVDGLYRAWKKPRRWLVRVVTKVTHDGLQFELHDRMAYVADDRKHWDTTEIGDRAVPPARDNSWEHLDDQEDEWRAEYNATHFWNELPQKNRGRLVSTGVVKFEDILAIDEDGDDTVDCPVVFVEFPNEDCMPRSTGVSVIKIDEERIEIAKADRIKFFPEKFPQVELPNSQEYKGAND